MRKSLFWQIFSSNLSILVLSVILLVVFFLRTTRETAIETEAIALKKMAFVLKNSLEGELSLPKDRLNTNVENYAKLSGARITLVDRQGVVIADSKHDFRTMENHIDRPEIKGALGGEVSQSLRYSSTLKLDMLYVAIGIPGEINPTHVLRLALPITQLFKLQESLRYNLVLGSLLVLFFSLVGSIYLLRNLVLPISDLTKASSQLAKGDFDVVLPENTKSGAEFNQLKESFSLMAVRIKNLIVNLTDQKFELQNIINSLSDPLIVYDSLGRINRWNDAFENKLADKKIHRGLSIQDILPEELAKILKSFFTGSFDSQEYEFKYKGRYYSPGRPEKLESGEATVIIYDISEERLLEKMKRDFTVNVSHEIRTPLTAIYGFLESIGDHVTEEGKPFLDIIKKNTYRMLRLVEDLKELSTLEGDSLSMEMADFDLKPVILETLKGMESSFKNKGLTHKTVFLGKEWSIHGDSYRLHQVMYNLIENSLRYTDQGGIAIYVRKFQKQLLLLVKDTGIGIPLKYQERVFERFYVVDKSRSRSMGGTGLGLSIVKHIVLAHEATLKIKSEPGQGTRIYIFFPQK